MAGNAGAAHEKGGLSVYFRDITERKQQDERVTHLNRELEQRVEELRTILKVAPVGLAITNDPQAAEMRANAYFEELAGVPPGTNISRIGPAGALFSFYQDDRELPIEEMPIRRAMIEGKTEPPVECRLVQAGGKEFFVLVQATPLFEPDGRVRGAIGAYTDITASKRAEKSLMIANRMLERSNADLQQFAYAAAHDLQEPLRNLTSYTELIAKRYQNRLDAEGISLLEVVIASGARMQTMIRDLLAYCQALEPVEHSLQTVDANIVVQNVLTDLRASLDECAAEVNCDTLPVLRIAESQLSQVLRNLIGNALKYRSAAPPRIRISAAKHNGEWVFSVADNGIGIKPEYRDRIFGLFKRLHGVEIPGTGIGLAICKRIIEYYGGRIWVESEYGKGSIFYFGLPENVVVDAPSGLSRAQSC